MRNMGIGVDKEGYRVGLTCTLFPEQNVASRFVQLGVTA